VGFRMVVVSGGLVQGPCRGPRTESEEGSKAYLGYYPEQFPIDADKVGFIALRLKG